jgi:hypothetical protein
VTERQPTIAAEVRRYLRTGETDPHHVAWPGGFLEAAQRAHQDLRDALVLEVMRRVQGRVHRQVPDGDMVAFTRRRVEPMVRGLFPRAEQEPVLGVLERSVVFLTTSSIESVLRDHDHDGSAWDLANLFLASTGAELLGKGVPRIVGLSEGTTCYVSPGYFAHDDPLADFIVHEAAHVFHNCKRRVAGLKQTRRREWLLDIAYAKREIFAYSCEAYSTLLSRAGNPTERRQLADELASTADVSDERVDAAEVGRIVREAAAARNGWKVILARCAPPREPLRPPLATRCETLPARPWRHDDARAFEEHHDDDR